MAPSNSELLTRSVEAFARGDWNEAVAPLAPDVVWSEMPSLGPDAATYTGIEEARTAIQSWTERWSEYELELVRIEEVGDDVVLLLRERGRGALSGASTVREFGELATFEAGRIVRVRLFGSWREALEAAGIDGPAS